MTIDEGKKKKNSPQYHTKEEGFLGREDGIFLSWCFVLTKWEEKERYGKKIRS